ncbi:Predicted dehydrogenase [Paenibacillus sp. 1_12]|uniref:Gfo/Idh/MocA family protein n=1 Tax=Paenibacillus sp. 1_12 TaxID=1566278 RepID=UPI0008EB7B2A|nr:Gfo/Idh/MocA family oxidoreductase [Paenibacillus sp. 1_12]SFL69353.1 Predicted dehydrogenase [Paenibacillus sp. 1_12]
MVRFGVIGTNRITEQFIAAARECEGVTLTAVYSRTEQQAHDFAAKFGIPHQYTDLESLAQSDQVDAVYIASPNSFHASQAILMMEHGKHILCEKPLASNGKEVRVMIESARRNNVLLMEALKSTLLPNFQAIREHLPEIGQVRRYAASYCQYSSRYDAYKQGTILNAFNPFYSNGSLMDLGVYCIYPMVVLFGQPLGVQANGLLLDSGVDGQGSLILKYSDMDAVITHSKISPSYLPTEIQGENGTMIIDKINSPEKVEIHYRNGSIHDVTNPQPYSSMYYEVQEFIDVLSRGERESTINSHLHSMQSMDIMDEARRQIGLVFPADQSLI